MEAFRKFDPYVFLAGHAEAASSEVTAEASETLAGLATLAGRPSQSANERSDEEPDVAEAQVDAKSAKFAKADDERRVSLATLETLAPSHSQNENVSSGSTLAKAAKPANPSGAGRAAIIEDGGAVRERQGTPSETALLAPGTWFNRFGLPGEPPFDQPCRSRRGLVERSGAVLLHFCVTCGAWGAFGYGAVGDRLGRWYCREHLPRPTP